MKKNRRYRIVSENSEKYHNLIKLNNKYNLIFRNDFQDSYNFSFSCPAKRNYDRLTTTDYLLSKIEENVTFFKDYIDFLEFNIKENSKYIEEISAIDSTITEEQCKELKIKFNTFVKIEEKIFMDNFLTPIIDGEISVMLSYTSPQGRNYYCKEDSWGYLDIKKLIKDVEKMIETKTSQEYLKKVERSKMSDSLRYDILKRDNFRCQICGVTAADGYKLHVDHIVPVSKGGKTIESNLRTLCERCNIGKSDKI